MITSGAFAEAAARLEPLDAGAASAAAERQLLLTKPPGSLGRIEDIGNKLAGIAGRCPPPVPTRPAVAVFAADHGVVAAGVTNWPQEVTAQMIQNFVDGGAAISVIARQVGAEVHVIDVGVAADLSHLPRVRHHKVRPGTADLSKEPAMTQAQAGAALDVGAATARTLVDEGADLLVTGEMGIGNTTPSAALIAALLGLPADAVTGRGTAIDDERLQLKSRVVADAVARLDDDAPPLAVLAAVGGLEIAALAGFMVAGAAAKVPVLVDGVICCAALLVAERLAPGVSARCLLGHRSTEPGAGAVLDHLGVVPILDLGLRLGEGSGATLAVPLVQTAARLLCEMATFAEADVGTSDPGR